MEAVLLYLALTGGVALCIWLRDALVDVKVICCVGFHVGEPIRQRPIVWGVGRVEE